MPSRAGSPNKNKQRLLKTLQAEYGEDFNPIMEMAKNASRLQDIADDFYKDDETLIETSDIEGGHIKVTDKISTAVIATNAWGRIAEYVTPKLKSVEIIPGEDEEGKPLTWTINVVKPNNT